MRSGLCADDWGADEWCTDAAFSAELGDYAGADAAARRVEDSDGR